MQGAVAIVTGGKRARAHLDQARALCHYRTGAETRRGRRILGSGSVPVRNAGWQDRGPLVLGHPFNPPHLDPSLSAKLVEAVGDVAGPIPTVELSARRDALITAMQKARAALRSV